MNATLTTMKPPHGGFFVYKRDTHIDGVFFVISCMKHFWFILLIAPLFGQNPCEDKEYQRIKGQIEEYGLDYIESREWDYFQLKDEQCSKFPEYKNLNIKEKEYIQPRNLTITEFIKLLAYLTVGAIIVGWALTPV